MLSNISTCGRGESAEAALKGLCNIQITTAGCYNIKPFWSKSNPSLQAAHHTGACVTQHGQEAHLSLLLRQGAVAKKAARQACTGTHHGAHRIHCSSSVSLVQPAPPCWKGCMTGMERIACTKKKSVTRRSLLLHLKALQIHQIAL